MDLTSGMRMTAVVVAAACLCGCETILSPRLDLPDFGQSVNQKPIGSYENARAIAQKTQGDLQTRLKQLDDFDTWTAIGIFATGLAATAGGIYGAHRDFITGGALVGASLLGSRTLIPVSARRGIFSQGQAAIECGMVATDLQAPSSGDSGTPGGGAAPAPLASAHAALSGAVSSPLNTNLPGTLARVQLDLVSTGQLSAVNALAGVKAAELAAAVQRTNEAVNAAETALGNAYAQRPRRLEIMVRSVVVAVNAQVEGRTLDPSAALQAAQQGVTSLAKSYQDTAKQALDAVKQQEQKAQETSKVAKLASDAASGDQTKKPAKDAADQLQAAAQNAQDLATQIKPILNQIISTAGLNAPCFGALIPSQ